MNDFLKSYAINISQSIGSNYLYIGKKISRIMLRIGQTLLFCIGTNDLLYRSCPTTSTLTFLAKQNADVNCLAFVPKSCIDSGQSIPDKRILICLLSEVNIVIVSPSLILTTFPFRIVVVPDSWLIKKSRM